MVFFLLNCLGIRGSCRRNSNGAAAIPRFQITQIPDDGINQLLKQKKPAMEEKSVEPEPVPEPNIKAKRVSNWKPYHNASMAVSSALTSSASARQQQHSMNLILYEEGEYVKLIEENKKSAFVELKEEDQAGKFIRTPTPDALVTFAEIECNEEGATKYSGEDEKEAVEGRIDDSNDKKDNASTEIEREQSVIINEECEALPEILKSEIPTVINDIESEMVPIPLQDLQRSEEAGDLVSKSEEVDLGEREMSLENLFSSPLEAEYINVESLSGLQVPKSMEIRMSLRCKTRVTEMATWFEKQMACPEHNEIFEN